MQNCQKSKSGFYGSWHRGSCLSLVPISYLALLVFLLLLLLHSANCQDLEEFYSMETDAVLFFPSTVKSAGVTSMQHYNSICRNMICVYYSVKTMPVAKLCQNDTVILQLPMKK